jgi:hypothetical protein
LDDLKNKMRQEEEMDSKREFLLVVQQVERGELDDQPEYVRGVIMRAAELNIAVNHRFAKNKELTKWQKLKEKYRAIIHGQ